MTKVKRCSYKDLFHLIGNPGTIKGKAKIKSELVTIKLPYTFYNWSKKKKKYIPVNYIKCHKSIAAPLVAALTAIKKEYGEEVAELGLNKECGGSYNHRKTRNRKWWSVHSWGAAVDLWCHLGKYGKKPKIPKKVVKIMTDHGFYWGGYWRYPDGMHFSRCNG